MNWSGAGALVVERRVVVRDGESFRSTAVSARQRSLKMGTATGSAKRTRLDPSSGGGRGRAIDGRVSRSSLPRRRSTIWIARCSAFSLPTLQRDFGWSEAEYGNMVSGSASAMASACWAWAGCWIGSAPGEDSGSPSSVERGGDGPRGGKIGGCVLSARGLLGLGESGEFSGGDQDGVGVVSKQRACAGGRDLQRGEQRRRGARADHGSMDRADVGMEVGVHRHRRRRIHLADFLAGDLSRAGETPEGVAGGVDDSRSDRLVRRRACRGCIFCAYRQTWAFLIGKSLHRSGVAVLSVLASEVSRRGLGGEARRCRRAARRNLCICGYWIRRWRLVLERADQARLRSVNRRGRQRCSSPRY